MPVPPLDHHATGYQLTQAYWLARASELAYQDEEQVNAQAEQWGFERVRFLSSPASGVLPLEDTQAFVAGSRWMVIVAFRGTEPRQVKDWLTDGNAPATPAPGGRGLVHLGFNDALTSVYVDLRKTVTEFLDNNQTLWITGHSLGGALAMLAGARLHFEDSQAVPEGIYTYGQPRTCDHLFSAAYNAAFAQRHHRFVNNNDIVPQLPPEPMYHHVDALRYFDANGRLHERIPLVAGLADRANGVLGDPLAPESDGIRDHYLRNYLAHLEVALG